MENSPIQVVLNTNNFIEEVENKGGDHPQIFSLTTMLHLLNIESC